MWIYHTHYYEFLDYYKLILCINIKFIIEVYLLSLFLINYSIIDTNIYLYNIRYILCGFLYSYIRLIKENINPIHFILLIKK